MLRSRSASPEHSRECYNNNNNNSNNNNNNNTSNNSNSNGNNNCNNSNSNSSSNSSSTRASLRSFVAAWEQLATFLDGAALVRTGCSCADLHAVYLGEGISALLAARWCRGSLRGTSQDLLKMDRRLSGRRCAFLPNWTGDAASLDFEKIRKASHHRPEALHFLWETRFSPGNAATALTAPLTYLDATPVAFIRLGTASLTFYMRLLCVAEAYFNRDFPHQRLLCRLQCDVDHGPTLFRGGRPGPGGHEICGEGHRWSLRDGSSNFTSDRLYRCAVAQTVEESSVQPLFCSLRESYLRPAWRNPSVLQSTERHMMYRCEHLNGEEALPKLEQTLRLLLTVYRCEDDEDPDEPA